MILLDNRGTGSSQAPQDPATYRVDRLVRDVEALRDHLGLERMDLFGHSASGGTCLLYAVDHPRRLDRLVLVDPSLRVTGLPSDLGVDEVLAQRAHEPWYAGAVAALHAEATSPQEPERYRSESAPLLYGRWNAAAGADGGRARSILPGRHRGVLRRLRPRPRVGRLAALSVPVQLVAGEYDIWPTCTGVRAVAALFRHRDQAVLPRAGHFPWVDDPVSSAAIVRNSSLAARGLPTLDPLDRAGTTRPDYVLRHTRPAKLWPLG